MAIRSPEVTEICILGPIWRYMNAGNLRTRRGLNLSFTNTRIIFLGSASLKLPSNMNIALVQTGTMAKGNLEISEICIVCHIWRYMNSGNLRTRRGLNLFCTNTRIIFLGSASLKLPFDINIASVQTRYHGNRKLRSFGNLHRRSNMVIYECG